MDQNDKIWKLWELFVDTLGWGVIAAIAVSLLLNLVMFWKIFSKAGFSGMWAFLMFIPGLSFLALFYFAFVDWPVLTKRAATPVKRRRRKRRKAAA